MKKNLFQLITLTMVAMMLALTSCKKEVDPPSPDFTFEIDDKTVTFTNTSTDADSYSWDFGDASAAVTDENPVHTYDAYGDYDVRLTATNEGGDEIKKTTISVIKEWPAITIDGSFGDWADVPVHASNSTGTLRECKVTSDASLTKLYIYVKGQMDVDFPVIQIMINADNDATTGWLGEHSGYASDGADYQFEFYNFQTTEPMWAGLYGVNPDGDPGWPWDLWLTVDEDNGNITEYSDIVGDEMEFIINVTDMLAPPCGDVIGLYVWQQPADWSVTSGSLPEVEADPLTTPSTFSFQ